MGPQPTCKGDGQFFARTELSASEERRCKLLHVDKTYFLRTQFVRHPRRKSSTSKIPNRQLPTLIQEEYA